MLLAEATNMGLETMADSCGVSYDTLASTLAEANTQVVNFHHRLPMALAFGDGTLSSSDGQRFPVRGKSLSAKHSARYFGRGTGFSTYTRVSDQHSTFSTKIIVAPGAEAHYVLDDLVGNMTDLPIAEYATTPTARPSPTSLCSTSSASSSRPGCGTWERSHSRAPGRRLRSRPSTRSPGRC
ncbi:hypothetical protein GCM10010403_22570 [Glycomyces rutgersensis]|uniref:TnpA family transposase n=2 Tax=Glycomyces TaxID=58113 RepID=A0ABU2AYQ9_9ACTN|nr:TnpA family transposase [Glycomyces lechevalierae]